MKHRLKQVFSPLCGLASRPLLGALLYIPWEVIRAGWKDGDTTPFTVSGPGGEYLGFVGFTKELRYLGQIVHSSLTSDADVDKRTRSAATGQGHT